MPRFVRGIVVLVSAWLAALAFVVPARAAVTTTQTSLTCTIQASATASVNWIGGSGTYFWGPTGFGIDCIAVTAKGGKALAGAGAALVDVVMGSTGWFDNIVCGTGSVADDNPTITWVLTTPDDPGLEQQMLGLDLGYHIVFAATEGTLTWGDNATPGNPDPNTTLSSTAPVGGGHAQVSPWRANWDPRGGQNGTFPGTPPNGECANGFNIEGYVSGTLLTADL